MRVVSWLLFILSAIPVGLMAVESYISNDMLKNNLEDVTAMALNWQGQSFSIEEQLDADIYLDNWQNKIQKGTLQLKHNGEVFQEVELPVRIDNATSDRYYGLLAFVSNEDALHVLINKTLDEPLEEKTIVQVTTFTKDGDQTTHVIDKERTFKDKYLLHVAGISYEGYVTTLNYRWPSIFFPILYPFGTLVLSLILLIFIYTKRRIA
ncbi:hypothetical protein CH76_08920 [Lysinibacillus sp. BF-4]|nr:hypothetical protein CH76_08920 [Lysinibacillus sp. BF-4]